MTPGQAAQRLRSDPYAHTAALVVVRDGEVTELPSGWVDRLLDRPQGTEPGTRFTYDNGSAHELSAAVTAGLRTRR